ncbi:WD40 repeat domain-containing protein [Fimbriiglobus ruber]|uniref:High-affnity carbon uptake protein Hat/HatR n=1 Tax=Fimbriiglobus ruber TaxID=1908690 RepID=A0A225DEH3_9BACT|nr:WD40 repeat domain-containing protein [Fimbriiglobus ruber]OWK34517.1 High-affnity carbon uptake protein Hat/HatR [Fimbriiglobus ruber]
MIRAFVAALCATLFAGLVWAGDPAPTAASVNETLDKYRAEREVAAKTFGPAELAAADDLAARATAALKDGNLSGAARQARDARWHLPFIPPDLPPHVSRVLGVARLRHSDRVNALSYSPDGNTLASASRDGTVRLWDLGNGREILTYHGHEKAEPETEKLNVLKVPGAVFSPDGAVVASSGGHEIHVWDAKTGKLVHTLSAHKAPVRGLAFVDANTLVSGGDDRKVIVWDVRQEKPVTTFAEQAQRVEAVAVGGKGKLIASINAVGELFVYATHSDKKTPLMSIAVTDGSAAGTGVAFAGDGGIATTGGDPKIKLTSGPSTDAPATGVGATVRTYQGHTGKITALAATADGKFLITGGTDQTVRVWEVSSGKQLWSFHGHPAAVTAIAINAAGTQIASGAEDGSIRLWPLSPADDHRAATDATEALWTVAVSPDGRRFATGGADRLVRIYDTVAVKLEKPLAGHSGAVTAVVFLDAGTVASGAGDKLVKVWDLASGKAIDCAGHKSAVLAVAADGSGKLVVSGSADKTVRGWDRGAGKELWAWTGKSAVCAVAVRKDGRRVAVGTADGSLTILSVDGSETPKVLASVPAHAAGVAGVAYHPDGTRVVTCGGDGIARTWSLPDNGPPANLAKFEVPARSGPVTTVALSTVAFSADGRLIATGGADAIPRVWDVQTGGEVRGFRGHTDWVTGVAFAPDGRALISVGVDKAARVFEMSRPESSGTAGHSLPVKCVAVSRDGLLLATGSDDKTVKVWDLATGHEVATLTGATAPLNAIGFTGPNELVGGGDDGLLRWWSARPGKEIRTAPCGNVFNLAIAPDGKVGVVWARTREKTTGFELYGTTGVAEPGVTEKGREASCAVLSADAALGVTGGEDGVVRIWDLGTKDRVGGDWPLFVNRVADLALTPDKKTLIAIDIDGTVKIGDVAKRAAEPAIPAVTDGVNGLVVSPTGDKFATISKVGVVKLWDLKGKELRSWKFSSLPAAAAFTPNGKQLVTGNGDGTAFVLDLP